MAKKTTITISTLSILALLGGGAYYSYQKLAAKILHLNPETLAKLEADIAEQNETAFHQPSPQPRAEQPKPGPNETQLYWGDLHVHTALSFDSYLQGNRLGLDDAYRFAQGAAIKSASGEVMQLQTPLDFVAITDHAESFGLLEGCSAEQMPKERREFCQEIGFPTVATYMNLRKVVEQRPPVRPLDICNDNEDLCLKYADSTWDKTRLAANKYYRPGEFTTFAAYEYSPPLPGSGKVHRNVFFKGEVTPLRAVSAFDATTVLDLWRSLEAECQDDCEFLTIPHNLNKTWGIAYSGQTIDGAPYSKEDWALRQRAEPLAEIYQIKGSSECGYGVGNSDEDCDFETIVPLCEDEEKVGCSGPNSFVREGLKKGLKLKAELGFNPLQTGFIGSTDTHNSNPGDTEEWDYRGSTALYTGTAKIRLGVEKASAKSKYEANKGTLRGGGGLAAVWAKENSREAIFEAMQRRETYGTSGTRIKLRFFAGEQLKSHMAEAEKPISAAYQHGTSMGGQLAKLENAPEFFAWAMADMHSAKLQKIQIIKAWLEDGESQERVYDIACADKLSPDANGRCPSNGASVNMDNCQASPEHGAMELKTHWQDPDFTPEQSAFYYIRVLQNPSCRWTSYDALRLGIPPRDDIPATIQERAWSSPIWYTP